MIRVLSKLSGLWIRGGYYAGHEDRCANPFYTTKCKTRCPPRPKLGSDHPCATMSSYIMDVRITAGTEKPKDPQRSSLKQQNVGEGGSSGASKAQDGGKAAGGGGLFGKMFGGRREKDGL